MTYGLKSFFYKQYKCKNNWFQWYEDKWQISKYYGKTQKTSLIKFCSLSRFWYQYGSNIDLILLYFYKNVKKYKQDSI